MVTVDIKTIDGLFKKWVIDTIASKIINDNNEPANVLMALSDRFVKSQEQNNRNPRYPSIAIRRKLDPKPSDFVLIKSPFARAEIARKINATRSSDLKKNVFDITYAKNPTYIDIFYDIVILSDKMKHVNTFHSILYHGMHKNVGFMTGDKLFFDLFLESPLDKGNSDNFTGDVKKFFAGASITAKGYFFEGGDITTIQTSPRTTVKFVEYADESKEII